MELDEKQKPYQGGRGESIALGNSQTGNHGNSDGLVMISGEAPLLPTPLQHQGQRPTHPLRQRQLKHRTLHYTECLVGFIVLHFHGKCFKPFSFFEI